MNQAALPADRIINGEQEYAAALDIVIGHAQRQLLIFDQDLSIGEYASIKRFNLIHDFLVNNTHGKLTIVLHDSDFFLNQCPRLFDLLTTYGHKMTVYVTNSHAKIAKDCFILADNNAYIRRFHIDQARFKYHLDDQETTASLSNRFDELMQETAHTVSATKLGL